MAEQRVHLPDGAELSVSIAGSGPALLMIPGLGASRHVYAPIVPALRGQLTVVAYDPRGIGSSTVGERRSTMEQLAADAAAVLDVLGRSEAAVWGASMGGMVAQRLALDHPSRVSRLILACTSPGGPSAVVPDRASAEALLGRGAATPEEAYRRACTVLYSDAFQRAHPEFIAAEVSHRARNPVRGRIFTEQRHAAASHDAWGELPAVTSPTLVLHGTADLVVPVPNAELLAGRIPGARKVLLEGRGHLFFHEGPLKAAGHVIDFMSAGQDGGLRRAGS